MRYYYAYDLLRGYNSDNSDSFENLDDLFDDIIKYQDNKKLYCVTFKVVDDDTYNFFVVSLNLCGRLDKSRLGMVQGIINYVDTYNYSYGSNSRIESVLCDISEGLAVVISNYNGVQKHRFSPLSRVVKSE